MSKFFEDIVLSIAVVMGFAIALYLSWALVVQGAQYPPTLISTFLGIALGALLYRFMGGLAGTEFAMGLLKLGGSAAFVLGVIWFVGDRLKNEVGLYSSTESYRDEIKQLVGQRDGALVASQKRAEEADDLRKKLQQAPQARGLYSINEIKRMKPDDPFVLNLKRLVQGQDGPFSPTVKEMLVRVAVVAGDGQRGTFNICRDTLDKLNSGVEIPNTEVLFSRSFEDGNSASTKAERAGKIGENICANAERDFDVQLSCPLALRLFADKILSCAEAGSLRGMKVTIGVLAD